MNGTDPKIERMMDAGSVIQIFTERSLVEAIGEVIGVDGIAFAGLGVLIMVQPDYRQAIELAVKDVFPFQIYIPVAIFVECIAIEPELIVAEISGKVEVVFAVNGMCYVEIEIIKGGTAVLVLFVR